MTIYELERLAKAALVDPHGDEQGPFGIDNLDRYEDAATTTTVLALIDMARQANATPEEEG